MDCSPPCSCVHGILQARILEWVAIPFSRGSSQPGDPTQVSCTAGRFFILYIYIYYIYYIYIHTHTYIYTYIYIYILSIDKWNICICMEFPEETKAVYLYYVITFKYSFLTKGQI